MHDLSRPARRSPPDVPAHGRTTDGALCLSCHRLAQWSTFVARHLGRGLERQRARTPGRRARCRPWQAMPALTVIARIRRVTDRACSRRPSRSTIARPATPGSVAQKNVADQFANGSKFSRHPVEVGPWVHDPRENPLSMTRHVTCADCHNPHASDATPSVRPVVSGRLKGVAGVTSDGTLLARGHQRIRSLQSLPRVHGTADAGHPARRGYSHRARQDRSVERVVPSDRGRRPQVLDHRTVVRTTRRPPASRARTATTTATGSRAATSRADRMPRAMRRFSSANT